MREGARITGRVSVKEAAVILTITEEAVRTAIRTGKLKADLKYRQYWITAASVQQYPETRQAIAGRRYRRSKPKGEA